MISGSACNLVTRLKIKKEDHAEDNPALITVIVRNLQGRIADAITAFSEGMNFLYVHLFWFELWILLNTGHVGGTPLTYFPVVF